MDLTQPFACQIAYVWSDNLVNLAYYDHNGQALSQTSVLLKQEGDGIREDLPDGHDGNEPYCTWMPYQVGQAKTNAPPKNDFDK